MLDSLKALWISNDQANRAQWDADVLKSLSQTQFCRPFFDQLSELPEGTEEWKHVRFKGLRKRAFQFGAPTQKNQISQKDPNHFEVEIYDLSQGAQWESSPSPFIQPLPAVFENLESFSSWKTFFQKEWPEHFFTNLNRSFLHSGLVFDVPAGEKVKLSIHYHVSGTQSDFLGFHLLGQVASRAEVEVVESFSAQQFAGLALVDKLFDIKSGGRLQSFCQEMGSAQSHIVQHSAALLEKDAHWNSFDLTFPSLWTRHNTTSRMNGEGAESRLFGLYLNEDEFFCDHHTSVEHLVPRTESQQIYKGVLAGKSEAVFNGRVFIAEGAEKSNSQQLNKNLLLSKNAEIHTKPELKIYNDDVKAAHGATVGQLDPEQFFYFLSRGLSKEVAWSFLCQSFTGDVFREFADQDLSMFEKNVSTCLETMRPQDHV